MNDICLESWTYGLYKSGKIGMPVTDIILVPNSYVFPHELMISKNVNQIYKLYIDCKLTILFCLNITAICMEPHS